MRFILIVWLRTESNESFKYLAVLYIEIIIEKMNFLFEEKLNSEDVKINIFIYFIIIKLSFIITSKFTNFFNYCIDEIIFVIKIYYQYIVSLK